MFVVAGCADDAVVSPSPVASRVSHAESKLAVERAQLERIAKAFAQMLSEPAVREQLKRDLRESRITTEHKLALTDYVEQRNGAILNRLGAQLRTEGSAARGMITSLREMEVYMPVAEHRATWTGGPDLIVAAQLVEGDAPVGFRLDGTRVPLTLAAPPDEPVLVIVPAEARFDRPLPQSYRHSDDAGGSTIGTLVDPAARRSARETMRSAQGAARLAPRRASASAALASEDDPECDPELYDDCPEPPTGPDPVDYPPGFYLDYAQINDLMENWVRGVPEVEIIMIGPTYHSTSQGEWISCSGQGGPGPKHFNQDGNSWMAPYWEVKGQILPKWEVDSLVDIYNAESSLQVWEDDDQSCEIRSSGRSSLQQLVDNLQAAQRATSLIYGIVSGNVSVTSGTVDALRALASSATQSDDDLIGHVVYTSKATYPTAEIVNSDLVMTNGVSNGSMKFITYY